MLSLPSLVFYGAVAVVGIGLNCLVLTAFVRGRLYTSQNSSIYILALQTIVIDLVFITIHLIYWIPKAIDPDFLSLNGLDGSVRHIADSIGTYAWFHNALGHIFIATNRFAVLVYFERPIFTRRRVIMIAILHHLLAATVTGLTQFAIPCCRLTFNFAIFSYMNEPNGDMPNYSDIYFTVPINSLSTASSLFCYTLIFISVRRTRKGMFLQGDQLAKQRNREYRLTTATTMTNCFMNALVYLLNNSEVQRNLPFNCLISSNEIATEETTVKTIETSRV